MTCSIAPAVAYRGAAKAAARRRMELCLAVWRESRVPLGEDDVRVMARPRMTAAEVSRARFTLVREGLLRRVSVASGGCKGLWEPVR